MLIRPFRMQARGHRPGIEAPATRRRHLGFDHLDRPAVSTERLSLTAQGNIRYRLKTPYRDGTTDVVFEPLDFMARLAALVPGPRVNLTRYHGSFASSGRFS